MIIAVTGWGQPADRLETRNAGIEAHLVKPVDPQILKLIDSSWDPERRRRDA